MHHTDNYETPVCTSMACLYPSPAPMFLRSCQLSPTHNPFHQLLNFKFDSSPLGHLVAREADSN
jgi:hypothetical protein